MSSRPRPLVDVMDRRRGSVAGMSRRPYVIRYIIRSLECWRRSSRMSAVAASVFVLIFNLISSDLADGDRGCTDPEIQCDTDGAVCSSNMCVCPDCKKGPDNQESGDPWQGFGIGIVVILVVIVAVGLFNICKMKKQIKALEKAAKDHARIVTSTNLTQGPRAAIQESSSGLGTMTTLQNTKKDDVVLELDASKETDMADESFCLMASNTDAVSLKTGGEPDLAV
ncbi:uncharacterized protein LOC127841630 isoform X3 [Dreissena polymorpha]|uniref:uncharacterized protein LOC127841630 isoform X3 n=1 Tax=Dreissena polymorpha TaxID=45954 RepID=UPI00226450E8|nr:uncharacterized protein LOC127841630 isoform X3 [Dreissena polymorpha]